MRSSDKQISSVRPDADGGCRSVGGKLLISLFFCVFLGMGLLFAGLILREAIREAATYRWTATECTVLESGVEETGDDEDPYRIAVRYRYSVEGGEYSSSTVALRPRGGSDYTKMQRRAATYRAGGSATCYVSPERPEESVLRRANPLFVLFVFFPLIFVAIGSGGLWVVWRRGKAAPEKVSISSKAAGRRKAWMVPIGLGALFTLVGGVMFVFLGVLPLARLALAQRWVELPCTVISSQLRAHSSDDGTTYKVDILYSYEFDGYSFRSNRYDFANFSSSGSAGKRAIVRRYPSGSTAMCYVDPGDPTMAVLSRRFRPTYLLGLIPLAFLAAGLAVLRWGVVQSRAARDRLVELEGDQASDFDAVGPAILKAKVSPAGKLLGTLFLALFWNGIVSVFLVQVVASFRRGNPEWFLTIFLVPFVLVGLLFIGMVFHSLLALVNPRPVITMTPGSVRLGDDLQLDWRMSGRASRIDRLRISIEGREEATYQRGTDTHTDREVFLEITAAEATTSFEIARGAATVHIPDDTMHSFAGSNNKIVWTLKVAGDIPRWPDVDEEFDIEVRPLPIDTVVTT